MKLYLISRSSELKCFRYLVEAAAKRDIGIVHLNPYEAYVDFQPLTEPSLLYRISDLPSAQLLEFSLVGPQTSTCYTTPATTLLTHNKFFQYQLLQKAGVPIAQTIALTDLSTPSLERAAAELGFPMIVKIIDGQKGIGVAQVDSLASLKSVLQLLAAQQSRHEPIILQRFIHEAKKRTVRAIVVGDAVVSSYEYRSDDFDFRSNASGATIRDPNLLSEEAQDIAVRATRAIGVECAGVDLLPTDTGYIVAEVNFPCNFSRAQDVTGIDVAGHIVDHLLARVSDMANAAEEQTIEHLVAA